MGQQVGDGGSGEGTIGRGEKDLCETGTELVDGLAAPAAGLAWSVVEVRNHNCANPDGWPMQCDSRNNGGLFGAGG
jgi:hypothetical protein